MNIRKPPIQISDQVIYPGERKIVMLEMPRLYDWTPMAMPVHVINGKQPGPVLCLTAAIHGDEINGVEIIRQFLKRKFLKIIHGTIIAVPIVNVYGFLYQDRYLMDRRDLNRSFPGSSEGSLAARLADLIVKELLGHATHIIDFHTGSLNRTNLPQIRANIEFEPVNELAHAFNTPVILQSRLRDGSLRQVANDNNIPLLLYEAGEGLRFDETAIKIGIKGIFNVMRTLGMIPPAKQKKQRVESFVAKSSFWIRAHHSGIIHLHKALGKKVEKGEVVATVVNPIGSEEFDVISPLAGIIIGKTNLPLVHEGAAILHVALFEELSEVEKEIESFHASLDVDPTG